MIFQTKRKCICLRKLGLNPGLILLKVGRIRFLNGKLFFITYIPVSSVLFSSGLKVLSNGNEFMGYFSRDKEWVTPMKILNSEGLGMKLPHQSFTMKDLMEMVPPDEIIDTIDVYLQSSMKMSMKNFYEKWNENPRQRLYNMLSFEFSDNERYFFNAFIL